MPWRYSHSTENKINYETRINARRNVELYAVTAKLMLKNTEFLKIWVLKFIQTEYKINFMPQIKLVATLLLMPAD